MKRERRREDAGVEERIAPSQPKKGSTPARLTRELRAKVEPGF
jgi:hypothetical protein